MQDKTNASCVQGNLTQESLDMLKSDFVICNYSSSYISRSVMREEAERGAADDGLRLEIARASVQMCHQWTEEWRESWNKDCFASLPVLIFQEDWFSRDMILPKVHVTLCSEGSLYEPGDFALALPSDESPGFLDKVYLGDLILHRQSEEGIWLLWSQRVVEATLQGVTTHSLYLTEAERLRFMLQLLYNVSLCASKFCSLTRGISELKSDTRIGALGEIVTRLAEQAIIESKGGEVDLPKLLGALIQIARFGGCEYSLFDAAQGLVAGAIRPE